MGWNQSIPLTSTNAVTTPSFYTQNWDAIEDFLNVEHFTLTSVNSGTHLVGETGVLAEGGTSVITALSTAPGSGAVAFDTTVGAWVYNGAGDDDLWKTIHTNLPTTRVQAYLSASWVPTSGSTTIVPFNAETTDSLTEFSTSTYVFSAKDAGYFYAQATLSFNTNTYAGGDAVTLSLSGSAGAYRSIKRTTMSSGYSSISLDTIAEVESGGTLAFFVAAPSSKTTTVNSGAGCSFLRIHRIS